jgi:hypothetical protein
MDHCFENQGPTEFEKITEFERRIKSLCCELSALPGADPVHVHGSVSIRPLGRFDMMDVDCNLGGIIRDKRATLKNGGRYFCLVHQRSGGMLLEQGGRTVEAGAGSFVMFDDTMPFKFISSQSAFRHLALHIPRVEVPADLHQMQIASTAIAPSDIVGSLMLHLMDSRTAVHLNARRCCQPKSQPR